MLNPENSLTNSCLEVSGKKIKQMESSPGSNHHSNANELLRNTLVDNYLYNERWDTISHSSDSSKSLPQKGNMIWAEQKVVWVINILMSY